LILSISSDLPTFKALSFGVGLNMVVADRTAASTEGQTRNSAGKTSVVEVIHFLIGADAGKASPFQSEALAAYAFHARLRLGRDEVTVSRRGSNANQILLSPRDADALSVELSTDKKSGVRYLPLKRWRELLGQRWFGLPLDPEGTAFEASFSPSFRSLVGYFARRHRAGGFVEPQRQNERQQPGDWQVGLSYLLGLDWTIPRAIEELRLGEATLRELRKAIREGALGGLFGSAAEIRPELTRIEDRLAALKRRAATFEVHENYRELASGAARIRQRMKTLRHQIMQERQSEDHLKRASESEVAPREADLDRVYRAVGIELPGVARKRFEDVAAFQRSVIGNRQAHLAEQVARTAGRIRELESEMAALDGEQAAMMVVLEGKGALDDFTRMTEEIAGLETRSGLLLEKLRNAEILEGRKTQSQIERLTLHERLQADHKARADEIRAATRRVDATIRDLYDDRQGNLIVDATVKGPEFRIDIQGDGNRGGIDHMEIFCFDLMLFEGAAERFAGGPGFLIHDSHLFDGVDARQVRSAILRARTIAATRGGQYVVTLNSEILPLLDLGAEILDDVVEPRLSDTEDGGLYGVRFDLS
jgi:uncharacterized protein YydD (DUF2326 family)